MVAGQFALALVCNNAIVPAESIGIMLLTGNRLREHCAFRGK
jgi:hypothetical protein